MSWACADVPAKPNHIGVFAWRGAGSGIHLVWQEDARVSL
jgi:hypothetical protein